MAAFRARLSEWAALAVGLALLLGVCWLLGSSLYWRGYSEGLTAAVESLGKVTWGYCMAGNRLERCARTSAGDLLVVRGMPR